MDESKQKRLEEQGWKVGSVVEFLQLTPEEQTMLAFACLLYTSDAADERSSVDLGGRRIIKKKKQNKNKKEKQKKKQQYLDRK